MADYPPFMNASGTIPKILAKIIEAKTPQRFTQDYLAKTLGFPGGSAKPFIPLQRESGCSQVTERRRKFTTSSETRTIEKQQWHKP
jgi:hypothetical protein